MSDGYKEFIELEHEELKALREFLEVLFAEKQALCSFSLEEIGAATNKKEEFIEKLKVIGDKKLRAFLLLDREILSKNGDHVALADEIKITVEEVGAKLKENLELLTYSFQRVKYSLEKAQEIISSECKPA